MGLLWLKRGEWRLPLLVFETLLWVTVRTNGFWRNLLTMIFNDPAS